VFQGFSANVGRLSPISPTAGFSANVGRISPGRISPTAGSHPCGPMTLRKFGSGSDLGSHAAVPSDLKGLASTSVGSLGISPSERPARRRARRDAAPRRPRERLAYARARVRTGHGEYLRNFLMPPSPVAPSCCERGGPMSLRKTAQSGPMSLRTGGYIASLASVFQGFSANVGRISPDLTPISPGRISPGRISPGRISPGSDLTPGSTSVGSHPHPRFNVGRISPPRVNVGRISPPRSTSVGSHRRISPAPTSVGSHRRQRRSDLTSRAHDVEILRESP